MQQKQQHPTSGDKSNNQPTTMTKATINRQQPALEKVATITDVCHKMQQPATTKSGNNKPAVTKQTASGPDKSGDQPIVTKCSKAKQPAVTRVSDRTAVWATVQ